MQVIRQIPTVFISLAFFSFFCCQSLSASDCCNHLLLDDVSENRGLHPLQGNRLGFYEKLGEYEARPAYRQLNGDFFLFYSSEKEAWVDTQFFFGATLFSRLENRVQSYCLEDYAEWVFYNNSRMEFTEDLKVNCSRVEEVCCHKLRVSSSNAENSSYYGKENSKTLGDYVAIGTQNGRYLYQQKDEDRFLEYGDRYWIVSSGVGKSSGHLNHLGGSVCPEHISDGWQISQQDSSGNWGWMADPGVLVSCLEEPLGDKVPPGHFHPQLEERRLEAKTHHLHMLESHQREGYRESSTVTILGVILFLLLLVMLVFFTNRFHKAWGRGAHGKQLISETFVK